MPVGIGQAAGDGAKERLGRVVVVFRDALHRLSPFGSKTSVINQRALGGDADDKAYFIIDIDEGFNTSKNPA